MKLYENSKEWIEISYDRYPKARKKTDEFISDLDNEMKKRLDNSSQPYNISNGGMFFLIAFAISAWALDQDLDWYSDEIQKIENLKTYIFGGTASLLVLEIIRTFPLNIFFKEIVYLNKLNYLWNEIVIENISDFDALERVEKFISSVRGYNIKRNSITIRLNIISEIMFLFIQVICFCVIALGGFHLWSEKHVYETRKEAIEKREKLHKECLFIQCRSGQMKSSN
ncbi:hypothetical protein CD178_02646 [Komagataeibacter saccharivorans]|uniref:Uncharacterized protein n=1 Tax=Komagataeibacter saccharivorans TaxID=265959 RepID=A0A347WEV0_9PROT|nr:hypothetical protein [Komagataeibacter saccharivorans]AXY23393.1 hypothetical protein CD178_02646 [Komagataeibacter saccharivorans]